MAEWLDKKIGRRREFHSNRAFAEYVGLSEGTVRNLRKLGCLDVDSHYQPQVGTLRKIAEKFPETSLAELARMAGIELAEPIEASANLAEDVIRAASRLTPENQRLVQRLIETLLAEQRAEEQDEG